MADIINFGASKTNVENEATNKAELNIYEKVMELKEKADSYGKDEMVDTKDWDGECWKAFFEKVVQGVAQMYDLDPWDVLVVFMHEFLMDKGE